MSVIAAGLVTDWTHTAIVHSIGYGLLAGILVMGCAFVFRPVTLGRLPVALGILLGMTGPSLLFVLEGILHGGIRILDPTPLDSYASGLYVLGVFTASVVGAAGGCRLGDHLACAVFDIEVLEPPGEDETRIRSAAFAVSIALPAVVDDVDGCVPVGETIKQELSGRTLLFPGGLSSEDLRSRLCARLEKDFDIDCVHVEFTDDGTVDVLALGQHRSGLSRTLPPDTVAVAFLGDGSPTASAGAPIEIWAPTLEEDATRLVTTGHVRGTDGDVVTAVVDANAADSFDCGRHYQLTTRQAVTDDTHELIRLLHLSGQTVTTMTVETLDSSDGAFVDWLPETTVLIERGDDLIACPDGRETIRMNDTVHTVGLPENLSESI